MYGYYENGTISEYFADQEFNLLQMVILLKDIFLALEELKSIGFVHKCFNEDNIYVAANTIKIGGFEFCEEAQSEKLQYNYHLFVLERMSSVLQSIPPEVILNKTIGTKSGVYCLGALMFKLIYRKPHFPAKKL